MKKWFKKLWCCKIWGWYDWTSAAQEGVKLQLLGDNTEEIVYQFYEYAKCYCKRCDKVNPFSQDEIDRAREELEESKKKLNQQK